MAEQQQGKGLGQGQSADSTPQESGGEQREQAASEAGEAQQGQAASVEQLKEQVHRLEEQNAELQDQFLRKAAEYENFRKRMLREREEGIRYANAALLSDVLPIIDDFERAIQSATESKDFDAFHAGVSLIERQLVSVLERNWGLKRFSAEGEVFDPEKHEAITAEESSEHKDPVVLEDYQKGYYLHDRVLRPAKVKVAKPVSGEGSDEKNAGD
jgi:molecular chaperone GrpE